MSEFAGTRSWAQGEGGGGHDSMGPSPGKQTLVEQAAHAFSAPVQMREAQGGEADGPGEMNVHALAGRGTATAGGSLPYFDIVQAAFGHHDISGLIAHTGEEAGETAKGMGAKGYTAGRHVVLGPDSDLFTVAHEAAHYVEQRHGLVNLAGGVGAVGDVHEQRADAVAAKVVAGESAEGLLDEYVGKGNAKGGGAGADRGPVQKQTEVGAAKKGMVPAKVDNARNFEKKLGIHAYGDARSHAAATTMIDRLTAAVIPNFNAADADHQQGYSDLFGKDQDDGAWSAGQVGKDFAVLQQALTAGNLREKMTAVYNASLGGFKKTVEWLMKEDANEQVARGLDHEKVDHRRKQRARNPFAKDLFRDPGNPFDRKKYFPQKGFDWEYSSNARTKAEGDEQKSKRTLGELNADGIGLSAREENFMFGAAAHDDASAVKWKEGGTYWQINDKSRWVKKYQEKLLMPVTAGPSGTAQRLFQSWEYLGKPTLNVDFRLALLGWMLTSNDHSFHEIMTTSAQFGMPYKAGLDAYRNVEPYSEAELRAIAHPEGFPDEENYRTEYVTSTDMFHDGRIRFGEQKAILATDAQVQKYHDLVTSGRAYPGTNGGDVAKAMALLVYTDDKNFHQPAGDHTSAYEFINNVLKGKGNLPTMLFFLRKDPNLWAAWRQNKFSIQELVAEAKTHAHYAVQGLDILRQVNAPVFRGYRSDTLPVRGEILHESKLFSMSESEAVSTFFANKPDSRGRYHILCRMQSTVGRAIDEGSMAGPHEAEVLFAPTQQFRIITDPAPWAGGNGDAGTNFEVTMEEI